MQIGNLSNSAGDVALQSLGNSAYPLRAGVAMEIGHFPDAPHQPHFPSTTLMPGETLRAQTVWAFGAQ